MNWTQFKRDFKYAGFTGFFLDIAYNVINKLAFFKVLRCMVLLENEVHDEIKAMNGTYSKHFLSPEEMVDATKKKINRLPEDVAEIGIEKNDECLCLMDGDVLTNYCWYSNLPTRVNPDLEIHFHPEYKYAYRSFTIPPYRGKRLQGLNLFYALQHYQQFGFTGIAAYVDANNYNSLRSFDHLGFRNFGWIWVLRIGNRYFTYLTKKCETYRFSIHLTGDASSANLKIHRF